MKTLPKVVNGIQPVYKKIYQQLILKNNGNIFFSPLSIFIALSMLYKGSKGKVEEEIKEFLGYSKEKCDLQIETFFKIIESLKDENVLKISNSLWIKKGYEIIQKYLEDIKKSYRADIQNLDFSNGLECCRIINNWISEKTEGMIKDINFPMIENLCLVIINAIYFKGIWNYSFNPDETRRTDFYLEDGTEIKTQMMRRDQKFETNYGYFPNFEAIELPYKGLDFSMVFFVPHEKVNFQMFEEEFLKCDVASYYKQMDVKNCRIILPKFKFEFKSDLNSVLSDCGVKEMFQEKKGLFPLISKDNDLFVNRAFHKAVVEVDEVGTKAAAVTVFDCMRCCAAIDPEPFVVIDHPFIFVIKNSSDETIFLGRVKDPTKGV